MDEKSTCFVHMCKKSEKSTHKIFNSANFEWKKYKGKKNRGKKYIDFLYENTNFLNMFTLKMRRTHQFNFAAYILILTPPPLNWNKKFCSNLKGV
ncbi:unnamed protein product [Blepharisma stoltei]|uniref:Uncharacterized protein n=1 Tax=Blepharisma stoltei TaxID=1481888 RepID=A0AAU9KD37_9CILI|nr:unnamed protein product [Blepharisma stoltei]